MIKKEYYSQNGQDRYIMETYFPLQTEGLFVDIGANDGITLSNTYAFEKRGWTGYCIEPLDDMFKLLVQNRPASKCIHAIISDVTGKSEFLSIEGYSQMLSGELKKYDPRHLERVDREIAYYGGSKKVVKVNSYRFEDIIKHKVIDYLSIDVEGGELDIIKNINFQKYFVKIISIENNFKDNYMINLIMSFGFDYMGTLGGDNIFKNAKL